VPEFEGASVENDTATMGGFADTIATAIESLEGTPRSTQSLMTEETTQLTTELTLAQKRSFDEIHELAPALEGKVSRAQPDPPLE
jgi:hypothetical protein